MIERWTPKIKQKQCSERMTFGMWTDKDGEYVLYTDYIKAVEAARTDRGICKSAERVAARLHEIVILIFKRRYL